MDDLRVSFPKPCDESWDGMAPAGCGRECARCDKIVFDLSQFEIDEAEALLRSRPGGCVRARIGPDGSVELKRTRQGAARRMVVAAAATAGLLATGAPALAKPARPGGAIAGKIEAHGSQVRVAATDSNGRKFKAKVGRDGRYRIEGVPAGAYTLTFFVPLCGNRWTVENVVVGDGETLAPRSPEEGGCIVVGMVEIVADRG
jgi:hypothetical protein